MYYEGVGMVVPEEIRVFSTIHDSCSWYARDVTCAKHVSDQAAAVCANLSKLIAIVYGFRADAPEIEVTVSPNWS